MNHGKEFQEAMHKLYPNCDELDKQLKAYEVSIHKLKQQNK